MPTTALRISFDEPYFGLFDCPDPCAGTVLENRPDASETYDGVELQLIKSFSNGWMARVSFAWNDQRQHIGPGAIVDPNNETPGVNVSGPTLSDGQINARWQFNVSGSFPLPWGIEGGLNLFGREGFPAVYSVFVLTDGEVFNASLIQIGPATRYRTPKVFVADLQLSKTFHLRGVAITPTFDCFNLFNKRTILGRGGIVGVYYGRFTTGCSIRTTTSTTLTTTSRPACTGVACGLRSRREARAAPVPVTSVPRRHRGWRARGCSCRPRNCHRARHAPSESGRCPPDLPA